MTSVEEARSALEAARPLFGAGSWAQLLATLDAAYRAGVLEGEERGEAAFYVGEALLQSGDPAAAVAPLEDAVAHAGVDFSSWAEEELARARGAGSGEAPGAAPAAVDVSGHPELRTGSPHHDWVAHAQAKLAHLHHYGGQIDGLFGPLTHDAVKAFQASWGFEETGVVDQATWSALETSAPGITGTPGQAAAAPSAQPQDPAVVELPDDHVQGDPSTPEHHWNPLTPDLDPDAQSKTTMGLGAGAALEHTWKIPIKADFGAVTVKEAPVKFEGRVHTAMGEDVDINAWKSEKGPGFDVKIPFETWENIWGTDLDVYPKGEFDIGAKTAVSGTLTIKNEYAFGEIQFTLVEASSNELTFAKLTGSAGGKIENVAIPGTDGELFVSGKLSIGISVVPNVKWWAAQFGRTVAPAAATELGVGVTVGAEAIIATGFVAVAVAQLYVAYANISDQQALEQMQADAPKAVDDFAAGFVSAWGAGSAPGGFWGTTGASAGARQFEADVQAFAAIQRERRPELVIDDAFLDEVRGLWRSTAAEKAGAFRGVVEAMYGKMVRTAVIQAFLKAHPTSSLPGDHERTSYAYGGLVDGPVAGPDTQAGYAAARNANLQLNIDRWQEEWEAEYGR